MEVDKGGLKKNVENLPSPSQSVVKQTSTFSYQGALQRFY